MKKILVAILIFANNITFAQTTCECIGNGAETIVMDAGMGCWSLMYKPVTTYLADEYRICLINRDGYAGNPQSANKDSKSIPEEIYNVLSEQGIKDSVVLIGHSFGGLNVRMFQYLYPVMVKGLIRLDASPCCRPLTSCSLETIIS